MNLPNAITLARIAASPVLVALILLDPGVVAAALFVALAATDSLDGYLARSRGEVTRLGAMIDPLADKLLVLPALAALAHVGRVEEWAVAVIMGRELAVSGLRALVARRGAVVPANAFGKAKMWLQSATVVALLVVAVPWGAGVQALVYITVVATALSGLVYIRELRSAWRRADRREPAAPGLAAGAP